MSLSEVLRAAGVKLDRGKYKTQSSVEQILAAVESALNAKDRKIGQLNAQLAQSFRDGSRLAADVEDCDTQMAKLSELGRNVSLFVHCRN